MFVPMLVYLYLMNLFNNPVFFKLREEEVAH